MFGRWVEVSGMIGNGSADTAGGRSGAVGAQN
jgi:hypothetical protein